MKKYEIWDGKSDIFTSVPDPISGKRHWSAGEYIRERAPWAGQEGAKVMISGGFINGGFFLDFYQRVDFYKKAGLEIDLDNMTDREILDAMEAFDSRPMEAPGAFTLKERNDFIEGLMEVLKDE